MLLEPVFCCRHQLRRVGAVIPVAEGQVGENLPGVVNRDFGQNQGTGHLRSFAPIRSETAVEFILCIRLRVFLHLAQDFLPVHVVVLGIFLALADQLL